MSMVHQFHSRQSVPFVRASYKKVRTNLIKKRAKSNYLLRKVYKRWMKYVKHNFISHLKWPFAGTTHGYLGKTSLLSPYALQGHETRHYTGLRKLLLHHPFFSTYRAFDRLYLRIPYTHGQIH